MPDQTETRRPETHNERGPMPEASPRIPPSKASRRPAIPCAATNRAARARALADFAATHTDAPEDQ